MCTWTRPVGNIAYVLIQAPNTSRLDCHPPKTRDGGHTTKAGLLAPHHATTSFQSTLYPDRLIKESGVQQYISPKRSKYA